MRLPDPRTSGSNNPGATNVLRIGGKKAAAITLIGDLLKGLVPMLIAKNADRQCDGHRAGRGCRVSRALVPGFFWRKGGKGVATATGIFLGLSWSLTLVLLAIWLSMAVLFRYSSLAALSAAALAPFLYCGCCRACHFSCYPSLLLYCYFGATRKISLDYYPGWKAKSATSAVAGVPTKCLPDSIWGAPQTHSR